MRFVGVFNVGGGTFGTIDAPAFAERAAATLRASGITLDSRLVESETLIEALEEAAADPEADVLVVGGGDGTISSAAAICFKTGKPLAVLPGGTMNFFARALHMPLDLDEAIAALAAGRFYRVDIATANGQPFLNQYSVGLHARLIRIRESIAYQGRWAKMFAGLRAIGGAVSRPLKFEVEIHSRDGDERNLASSVVVSNNLLAEGHLPYADDLAGGALGLYIAKPMTSGDTLKLIAQVMLGRWKAHPMIAERRVERVVLNFPRFKRGTVAAIDGELIPLAKQVALMIHPGGLKVFAPQSLAPFARPAAQENQSEEAALRGVS